MRERNRQRGEKDKERRETEKEKFGLVYLKIYQLLMSYLKPIFINVWL